MSDEDELPTGDSTTEVLVTVMPLGADIVVRTGESLMAAAQRQGYFWPTRCRGQALCTACLFEVVPGSENSFGPVEDPEQAALISLAEFQARRDRPLRLGCQAHPLRPARVFKRGVKTAEAPRRPTGFWG
ncbi:2Fe-2S iron-sulfur cluster-binding protein [Actinacidiphila oryziradicis]|jgi:ferredoxin|uniref:2Fe-2S iron-sulfur cluster-binding protein n=1 Tax=Actinacidiphila oryziradicis TaxID=2571141 RepID=UPI0023F2DE46|nr:2Fe-2S iron-sulfur cluster-binding protein [Actinacidiphila oryziradicis]MCW2870415.1 ferredoxin [Actinacidiphila oryziradicis]